MGSVLYIHKDAPLRQQVIDYLTYFQTSSPSYLIMSSLELANFIKNMIPHYFTNEERC